MRGSLHVLSSWFSFKCDLVGFSNYSSVVLNLCQSASSSLPLFYFLAQSQLNIDLADLCTFVAMEIRALRNPCGNIGNLLVLHILQSVENAQPEAGTCQETIRIPLV